MSSKTLIVNNSGAELSYIDSGPPSKSSYITVFAAHGIYFTSHIFQKVQRIALSKGVRFVAFNRRNFPGSSPFTPDQLDVMANGNDQQRDAWIAARGHEVATFIDAFIQKNDLPPISNDGKSGGIVLLGWSLGTTLCLAAISNADTLPADIRARFASRVRALIVHEPARIALGLPSPEKNWTPLFESSIPAELRHKAFAQWITSYFDHGDLSKRDLDLLSYIIPSTVRPPSIFNMSAAEISDILWDGKEASVDLSFLIYFKPQLRATYLKAFFDLGTAELFPNMRISFLAGDRSAALGPAGMWAAQDDEKELGRGLIHFKLIHGVNHFMHWDDPERAVDIYLECINM